MHEHEAASNETSVTQTDPLLRTRDAARYIDMSEAYLSKARRFGRGPAFIKFGPKSVRYRRSALDAFIAEHAELMQ